MKTALDSNILSALWSNEPSALKIETDLKLARAQGGILICAPVYMEVMAHPLATRTFVQEFLDETGIQVEFDLDELGLLPGMYHVSATIVHAGQPHLLFRTIRAF